RSLSTTVRGACLARGVYLEEEDELAAYLHWYNSLPDDARLSLSETGRLEDPAIPYDREAALRAARAESRPVASWPWFLPEPEDPIGALPVEDAAAEDAAPYVANDFVR